MYQNKANETNSIKYNSKIVHNNIFIVKLQRIYKSQTTTSTKGLAHVMH